MGIDIRWIAERLANPAERSEADIQADIRTLLLDGDLDLDHEHDG